MHRRLLLILLFLCTLLGLYAQENWYLDKPILEFTFSGLETVSEGELTPIVRTYIGEPFTLDLFWEVQEKLYALEYFESIEANAQPGDEQRQSVIIEFKVVERPTVAEIILEGNRRIGRGEILDRILIKKGDMVSQTQVELDADSVSELYLEKGFMDAQVNGRIDEEDPSKIKVVFEIIEGFQTTIKSINFSGNSFASEGTLRRKMKTKPQALFSSGVFQESKFEEDIRQIEDYYGEHGFIDAKVVKVDRSLARDEKESKNFLVLTLYIEEGEQYNYGGIRFEGNEIFDQETLRERVRQSPGKILNKLRLQRDFQNVTDLYYENGYIYNIINLEEERDEGKKEITYTVKIVEKDRAHIENIILKGNEKTKDYVIYRELPFEVGDIFNKTKVIDGLENLYNLQYFTAVAPETPFGSAEGLMDLVLNLEEGNTAAINFGVMFSGGDYPVTGMVKWAENNFLGNGQKLSAELELSPLRQFLALSFEEPWLMGTRWLGGVSLSGERAVVRNVLQDIIPPITGDWDDPAPDPFTGDLVDPDTGEPSTADDAITDYEYALKNGESVPNRYRMEYTLFKIGLGLNTGYRHPTRLGWLGVRSGFSTAMEYLTYDDTLYRPFDPQIRDSLKTWKFLNKLGITFFLDDRDFFLNPSNGYYLAQGFTFAGGFLGGVRSYIRTDTTAEGFLTLFDLPVTDNWSWKMVLAGHSSLSFIFPQFGQKESITIATDLLYVDGMTLARGWPLDRNKKALWDNRLELRMPLAERFLWWVFFLDGVAAYDERELMRQMRLDDFLFSLGGGLRFTIPQFPIRLYLAQRFRFQDGRVEWMEGDLPLFGLSLNFVISLGGDTF